MHPFTKILVAASLKVNHKTKYRYSTAGRSSIENAQPMVVQTLKGQLAVAQNGNLTTAKTLKQELLKKGVGLFRTSDVEVRHTRMLLREYLCFT